MTLTSVVRAFPRPGFLLRSVALCFLIAGVRPAAAVIVGHLEADQVPSLSQSVMDAVGGQRWLFAHASVGSNMVSGMQGLAVENPGRYQLGFAVAGDGNQILPPPDPTISGTVYDAPRGNPGWAAKFAMFDNAVRNLGWRMPAVEIAMNKLCYIDTDADVNAYLAGMIALENSFPSTVFIYTAMPLQSGSGADWANILATYYNNAVRAHCAGGNRIMLDIADIESHDPQGNHITFEYQGNTYERMWSGYTSDGGHLNAAGARRVALGWYAAAAAVINLAGAAPEGPGGPGSDGFPSAADPGKAAILSIVPNPSAGPAEIRFVLPGGGPASLEWFDAAGRRVGCPVRADLPAGPQAVLWEGRDAAGRALVPGRYFVRLHTQGGESARSLLIVR